MRPMEQQKPPKFPQELSGPLDSRVHGAISRRAFMEGARNFAMYGSAASALVEMLEPDCAWGVQVPETDRRVKSDYVYIASPQGHGAVNAYLAYKNVSGKRPAVVVLHED